MNIRKRFIIMRRAHKRWKIMRPGWGASADIKDLIASIDPPPMPNGGFLSIEDAADMFRIPAHILNSLDPHPNATNARVDRT